MDAIDRFTAPTGVIFHASSMRSTGAIKRGRIYWTMVSSVLWDQAMRRAAFALRFRQRLVERTFILSTSPPPQTDTKV